MISRFLADDDGSDYHNEERIGDETAEKMVDRAEEIITVGAIIFSKVIPPRIFEIALCGDVKDDPLERVSDFVRRTQLLMPLIEAFGKAEDSRLVWRDMLNSLSGGVTKHFGRSPFPGHGNLAPAQIADLRIEALAAYAAGRRKKVPASKLQAALSESFATSFDSIRKWQNYCSKVYGESVFLLQLKRHEHRWETYFDNDQAWILIARLGMEYRNIWSKVRKPEKA